MLSKTSELAIQALVYLAIGDSEDHVSPVRIAGAIGASPTYTAKVTALLVRAGILRAMRGAKGGVQLERQPADISLIEIVEACQGRILGDYCTPHDDMSVVCSFHEAMNELHQAIIGVLGKWTLAGLLERTCPGESIRDLVPCKMKWSQTLGKDDAC